MVRSAGLEPARPKAGDFTYHFDFRRQVLDVTQSFTLLLVRGLDFVFTVARCRRWCLLSLYTFNNVFQGNCNFARPSQVLLFLIDA